MTSITFMLCIYPQQNLSHDRYYFHAMYLSPTELDDILLSCYVFIQQNLSHDRYYFHAMYLSPTELEP